MKKRGLIQPNILIHFKDFNFDKIPDIQSLIGRFERLELVYFALEIINNKSLSSGYRKICSRLFPFDNGEKMMRLIDKELNIAYEDIAEHHLVCMQTGLELLNILLCCSPVHKPWDFDKIPNGAEIKGINLLTILLLVNERIINDIDVPVKNENPDISAKDILANVVAPTLVENSDYSNFDIVTSPLVYLYKSTLFLEFCATHPLLSPALNKVLEKYGCNDIRTFLTVISGLFLESVNSKNNYCRFVFSEEKPAPKFFKELSFSMNSSPIREDQNIDYSFFRAYPLISISENEYVIVCIPFLFGKLYQSLVFDLSKQIGDGNKVREIISTEFSEQKLLFPLLRGSIAPKSPINLSGNDCDLIKKDSAPDYYVRNWNSSFLFELKDYSFRAKEKTSLSYEVLSNYLYSQFVVKKNGRGGAIRQLVNNVKAIIENDFAWDKDAHPKHIYPVLVLGNQNYLNYGITYLLNRFFKQELKSCGVESNSVSDLIIIDIDTLILYNDIFSRYSFEKIVKQYFVKIQRHLKSADVLERLFGFMQPFPEYMKQKYPLTSEHLAKNIKKLNTWKS